MFCMFLIFKHILIPICCLASVALTSLKVGLVIRGQVPGFTACLLPVEFHWTSNIQQKNVTPGAAILAENKLHMELATEETFQSFSI